MPTAASALKKGIRAIQAGRYTDAIALLQSWCDQAGPEAEAYPEAVKVLVRAYREAERWEDAIALCEDLAEHSDPALKHWAWQMLPVLSKAQPVDGPTTEFVTLPHAEADHTALQIAKKSVPLGDTAEQRQLLAGAREALEAQRYGTAVEQFEAYLRQKKQFDPAKAQTHIALARAYQGNQQRQEAINLCQHLLKIGDQGTKRWAHQFLEAIKRYPKARDPLAEQRQARKPPTHLQWDISESALVIAIHTSVYAGLVLSPLVPGTLWRDLGLALIQAGTITPELILPLAIALLPLSFPAALLYSSKEQAIRGHAREVVNYWITLFAIALAVSLLGPLWTMLMEWVAKLPLLFNLTKLVLSLAGFGYGAAPLLAILWHFKKPERRFRYPFILRFI